MDFKDYYATLGVRQDGDREGDQAGVPEAGAQAPSRTSIPGDKAAEAKFKEINEAYEVLGDPEKRKKYDELGANWRQYEQARRRRRRARRRRPAGTCTFGGGAGRRLSAR